MNQLPSILIAVLVFLLGWLVAALVSRGIKKVLSKTDWDDKLFEYAKINPKYKPHVIVSRVVFYGLMVFVFILFFNILGLQFVAEPIINMMNIFALSVPNILKSALILVLGWILASVLSFLVQKGGKKIGVGKLLAKWNVTENPEDADNVLHSAGRVVFYMVLLLFLPGVLGALHISAVSDPLSAMLASFLQFLPRLFGAALTLLIGWLIAKIVREILTRFLQSIGTEKLSERLGLAKALSPTNLSSVIGTIAFIFILIPTFIAALEALDLKGISEPAIAMLSTVLSMIPNIIIGTVLVLIGVWLGHLVGGLLAGLLEKIGFDSIFTSLGLQALERKPNPTSLSKIAGRILQTVIILLFVVEAMQVVNLKVLVVLTTAVLAYIPNILVAVIITGLGLFLGNFVQRILSSMINNSFYVLSLIAKYAIITLSLFMAIDQLGVARSIVNASFILILGGLALAFGLAFGLGGREFAASWLKKWEKQLQPAPMVRLDNKDEPGKQLE
jgi:hypothetical protein